MHLGQREAAVDAVEVMNDLIGDFVAGTNVLREYRDLYEVGKIPPPQMTCIQKMCISHLVLSLCKFLELRKYYGYLIPEPHRAFLKKTEKEIIEKRVRDFCNKCVGHILDDRTKRPLRHSEISEFLLKFGNLGDFLNWINDRSPESGANIVRTIEIARDELCATHNISPEDILHR